MKTTANIKKPPASIQALTREEKIELLQALEEKERREKDRREVFKPHPGQLAVLKDKSLERFVFAGNGSGKTALGVNDLMYALMGHNPHSGEKYPAPCRATVVLDKPDKIETVILPELLKWMNLRPEQMQKRGKPYISLITLDNGSTVRFIFWDQEPMTAEGIECDYVWMDEPCPRPLYIALRRAGRTKGRLARYLLTGTPLSAPWLRTEVYEPWSKGERADCACFRFGTESNSANLADGYIEKFSAVLTEKERGIRLRGEFFDLDGLALSHLFRRETHVLAPSALRWEEGNPCVIAVDPHPSKKCHAVLMGVDRDNRLYVLEEFSAKLVAREFTEALIEKGWFEKYRVTDIVCDSLGSADTTSGEGFLPFIKVANAVLSAHNIGRMRATTYEDKSDEDFIERIQDGLLLPKDPDSFGQKVPKLRVLSQCTGTISDIENVQWLQDKRNETNKPKLDISNKDFLSCVKYALATNIYFKKPKEKAYYRKKSVYGVSPTAKARFTYKRTRA